MSGFRLWLAVVGLAIAAGVVVPYGVLSGGAPSLDVFLFWCLLGLGVIVLVALGVGRWRG